MAAAALRPLRAWCALPCLGAALAAPANAQGDAPADATAEAPAAGAGATTLRFGGESRSRYERVRNPSFGRELADPDGYALQRTMLHAALDSGDGVTARIELRSSLVAGRRAGPRSNDEDRLDINQAWTEWSWPSPGGPTRLRLGRQEIEYGSARLVTARDGLNDRLAFDGVRWVHDGQRVAWGGWWTRPVRTRPGTFDNRPDRTQDFAALHVSTPGGPDQGIAGLAARRRSDGVRYVQGAGAERRDTVALRAAGRRGAWDGNWELGLQRGRFAGAPLRAWYVATDTGWTSPTSAMRWGLRLDIASGDRDRRQPALQTFHALFASTAFSGLAGLVGPANASDLALSLQARPAERITLTVGVARFWRTASGDGVYGIAGQPIVDLPADGSRRVGTQGTIQAVMVVRSSSTLSMTASSFRTAVPLRAAGLASHVGLFTAWWRERF